MTTLRSLLIERTAGNPFFLEESVRSLVETGALVGEHGAYRLTRPGEEARVPATVQAVLAARIDRLPAREKRRLQTAAIIGKDVPFPLLQAIAGLPDDDLQGALSSLQAAELVYPVSLYPEPEYTFKHALTHDVAYGSLLQDHRRRLHRQIVEAIERLYSDRLHEHAEQLAHQALRAEAWEKATIYGHQAGQKAAARSAYTEAVAFCEQTLTALEHRAEDRDALAQAIDLRLEIQSALFALGQWDRIVEHLRQAETAAERLGDRSRLAALFIAWSASLNNTGDPVEAIQVGRRAAAIAEELGDPGLRAAASKEVGLGLATHGDFRAAVEAQRPVADSLVGELRFERFGLVGLASAMLLAQAADSLKELGEFREALEVATEAVRIGQEADHRYSIVAAEYRVGMTHLRKGDLHEAIVTLERGVEHCEAWGIHNYWSVTATQLGYAYALSGRLEAGLPLIEQTAEQARARGHLSQLATTSIILSEAYLLDGRPEQAWELAEESLELATRGRQRAQQAYALHLIGAIAVRRDPPDLALAESSFKQALALAEELEMRPLQAHCHLGLSRLYRRAGRPDEARERLTAAVVLLRAMEMTHWLPDAEGELAALTDAAS